MNIVNVSSYPDSKYLLCSWGTARTDDLATSNMVIAGTMVGGWHGLVLTWACTHGIPLIVLSRDNFVPNPATGTTTCTYTNNPPHQNHCIYSIGAIMVIVFIVMDEKIHVMVWKLLDGRCEVTR